MINKQDKCILCHGTGWWTYDPPTKGHLGHSQICPQCCKHNKGWWVLTKDFGGYQKGKNNNCCKAGCGTMQRDLK